MQPIHAHRVAVVVLPGVIPLELGAATQVFGWDPHYELTVCTEDRAAPVPRSGFIINTSAGLEGLKRAETLIVPGLRGCRRHSLHRGPQRPTGCTGPWCPPRLDLYRSVCSSRGRTSRRTPRDNALAMD